MRQMIIGFIIAATFLLIYLAVIGIRRALTGKSERDEG